MTEQNPQDQPKGAAEQTDAENLAKHGTTQYEDVTPSDDEAVLAQVAEVFEAITPEQMIGNDIDTAKTAREYRKIAQAAALSALSATQGRKGLTAEEKIERMQAARARFALAVEALDRAIDAVNDAAEAEK